MAIIPTPTLRKFSGCALCGIAGVETVTTADGRFALCPDHMTKLAAGRLSADDRAMLDQKKQDSRGRWQDGPCALCADAADLLFEDARLTRTELRVWLHQYHYFCKHFVKALEGLLYRTPVDALDMRVELAKTLHSELGSGCSEQAHIRLLEQFAAALDLTDEDLAR